MRRRFWLVAAAMVASVLGLHSAQAAEVLKAGDRIVFLGDSITQAGAGPQGYVTMVRQDIDKALPDLKIEVIGAGISGNRVPNLEERLERDVISKKPTVVVIYIGINDVWHSQNGRGTPKGEFEKGLETLVGKIRHAGAKVILCTPTVIGEKKAGTNKLDEMLDEYADVTRAVAAIEARIIPRRLMVAMAVVLPDWLGIFRPCLIAIASKYRLRHVASRSQIFFSCVTKYSAQ